MIRLVICQLADFEFILYATLCIFHRSRLLRDVTEVSVHADRFKMRQSLHRNLLCYMQVSLFYALSVRVHLSRPECALVLIYPSVVRASQVTTGANRQSICTPITLCLPVWRLEWIDHSRPVSRIHSLSLHMGRLCWAFYRLRDDKSLHQPLKASGPTEIRTRIAGFKVQSANHYTIGPACGAP